MMLSSQNPFYTAALEVCGDVALSFAGFLHFIMYADRMPVGVLLSLAGFCRLYVFYRIVDNTLNEEHHIS